MTFEVTTQITRSTLNLGNIGFVFHLQQSLSSAHTVHRLSNWKTYMLPCRHQPMYRLTGLTEISLFICDPQDSPVEAWWHAFQSEGLSSDLVWDGWYVKQISLVESETRVWCFPSLGLTRRSDVSVWISKTQKQPTGTGNYCFLISDSGISLSEAFTMAEVTLNKYIGEYQVQIKRISVSNNLFILIHFWAETE